MKFLHPQDRINTQAAQDFARIGVTVHGEQTLTNKTLDSPVLNGAVLTGAAIHSPNLITPNLGTPTAGNLVHCTNLPLTTGVSGVLAVLHGGVGTSLTLTGGASQVLKQLSVGGAISVGQLAASDLSNGTSGTGAVILANAPTFTGNPVFASSTGSGAVVLAGSPTFTGSPAAPTLTLTAGTPTTSAGQLGLGTTTGFGNGTAATAVTTTTLGTGSGPSAPQTVVKYLEIDLGGTKYWLPLVQ